MKSKIPAGKCDRCRVGWKWSKTRRLVEDGMSTRLTNTHTARGFSDLYHVPSRNIAFTSRLPHITLCYIDSRFFCPGTIAHGSIRLPPRSLACSRGCSLATNNSVPIGISHTYPEETEYGHWAEGVIGSVCVLMRWLLGVRIKRVQLQFRENVRALSPHGQSKLSVNINEVSVLSGFDSNLNMKAQK